MNAEEEKKVNEELGDPDQVEKRDHHRSFSVAQFKIWRKGIMKHLNEILQQFQRDVVTTQVRVNLAWNGMNAVIRALTNKGLISEDDIRDAGAQLMSEARANMAKAKEAAEAGVAPLGLQRVPLEVIRDNLNEAERNRKTEEG